MQTIGGLCPLGEGELGPSQHNVARAKAYLHSTFNRDPSSHLATIDKGHGLYVCRQSLRPQISKGGCCAPFHGGSWIPILCNVAGAEAYLHAKFHHDPSNRLATIHQRHRQTGQDRQTMVQ